MDHGLPSCTTVQLPAEANMRPVTVRVREACRMTGFGRSKLYELIKDGHVATIKVGSMTLIPMRSLEAFLGVDARRA